MFHCTPPSFYFAVPQFHKHTKSTYRASEFLLPHSSRKFFDKTTMRQQHVDRRGYRVAPHAKALQFLSNNIKANYGSSKVLHGQYGLTANHWIMGALNPYNRNRYEWSAPWQDELTKHQVKQRTNRAGRRTSHVVETTGNDDHHIISVTDNLDRDAHLLSAKTEARWPLVQKLVFESFEWWKEAEDIQHVLISNGNKSEFHSTNSIIERNSEIHVPPLDESIIEKLLASFSPTQVRAMKPRTYSLMLQGYTCCLGNFRDLPLELSLLAGFGENIVSLSTDPTNVNARTTATPTISINNNNNNNNSNNNVNNSGGGGGGASRLFSLVLQVLFIGLLRHQSFADFRTLGLPQIGKLSQHPLGLEKLPNLTAQMMKSFLKKKDVDGAIKLGYAVCVYCSNNNSNNSAATSSFGVSTIPINCTVVDASRKIPQYLLESHFPFSRPFITLAYCWGWKHDMCRNINEVTSAAWLFELSTIALVSMVDCPVPCGVKKRILKAIQLVSASCDRWLILMNNKKNNAKTVSLTDSEKWSSASILISLKRLSPVLEMLSAIEENQEKEAQKMLPSNDVKFIEARSDGSQDSAVPMKSENAEQNNQDDSEETTAEESARKPNFFICQKRVPPLSTKNNISRLTSTSFSPSEIGVPRFLPASKNKNKNDDDDNDDDEYHAATFFGKRVRSAAEECFLQIAPYFDIEVNTKQSSAASNHENNHENSSQTTRFNVPRSVLAEVADACEFISTCRVFVGNNNEATMSSPASAQQKQLKMNYDKLNEKLQEVVLN